MIKPAKKIVVIAAIVVLRGTTTHSQSPLDAVEAIEMEAIARFASIAQAGTDPRVTASSPEQFAENGLMLRKQPAILISIDGEPAFVYIKQNWGDSTQDREVITFVMRCRGGGIVDISSRVFDSRPSYQPDAEVIFDNLFHQIAEFGRSVPAVMRLQPYERDIFYDMPVTVAFEYDQHGTVNPYGQFQYLDVQLAGAARSDDTFFRSFRGGSLYGQILIDGQFKPMHFQVDLQNFRTTAGPLLDHCRSGNENPMNREFISVPETQASNPIVKPAADLDLSFLEMSRRPYLLRIFQGRLPEADLPLHLRLTIPLAFYAAYSGTCLSHPEASTDYVYTNIYGERMVVPVLPDDFASFYEATAIYDPIMRRLYEENINNDFTFLQVANIYQREMDKWKADWEAILARYGCTGNVSHQFRKNVKADLPFLEYSRGSSNVLVDFVRRQYEIVLPSPIDIEDAKHLGSAEAELENDPVFTSSYPGRLLRAIAMGDFAKVEAIKENFRENISTTLGGDRDNPFSTTIRLAMELQSATARESGILTAYIIGRTYYLGACGDPTIIYNQDTVYWTEYVNGFGQYVGSTNSTKRTTTAEIPLKFDAIIRANDSIEVNMFFSREMAAIVSRLSCDSRARQHLEDNIVAYFNRQPPVYIGPVP